MDEDVQALVEEGCYYLRKLGAPFTEIAEGFGIDKGSARKHYLRYKRRVDSGEVKEEESNIRYWNDLRRDIQGNIKITLVDEDGKFYHGRRNDLERMDTMTLMAIFEWNKDYLLRLPPLLVEGLDKFQLGYDPLSPLKEVKSTLKIIEEILSKREKGEL